jgi:hypothetical protein
MPQQQSHSHHYVPQWYQRRFLTAGSTRYLCLDLHPETIAQNGVSHQRRALLKWGPAKCFYRDDLYTLTFGPKTTDAMEKLFFGVVDDRGAVAVTRLANYQGIAEGMSDAIRNLGPYMGAQRFRTPRGLDEIKKRTPWGGGGPNAALNTLQHVFQSYTTMWSEGVWEFVRATKSPTKFIVSDNPVTFYCKVMFPSDWIYPDDASLKQIGTRTLFPLGQDSCLIITHLQLARNPWSTPTEHRENARSYDQTLKHLGDIQFGRELDEDEVRRINYILKRRATRYIAAANEEWLYPERHVSITDWKSLDDDWFLLPHLWKVSFTSEIIMGGKDWSWAMDEYGRHPGQRGFRNKRMREREWATRQVAQYEWAKKRVGKSFAQIDKFEHGDVHDKMMQEFLEQGLLPAAQAAAPEE